jgi:hypothetical protein
MDLDEMGYIIKERVLILKVQGESVINLNTVDYEDSPPPQYFIEIRTSNTLEATIPKKKFSSSNSDLKCSGTWIGSNSP